MIMPKRLVQELACNANSLQVIEDFEEGVKAITPIASEGHDSREIAKDILNLHSIAAKYFHITEVF